MINIGNQWLRLGQTIDSRSDDGAAIVFRPNAAMVGQINNVLRYSIRLAL